MKKSTIIYLIVSIALVIIFIPKEVILVLMVTLLCIYLTFCFLEIYRPYSLEYTNERFGHTVLKPKYNIIYKLNNLIDGKPKTK